MKLVLLLLVLSLVGCGAPPTAGPPPAAPAGAPSGTLARDGRSGPSATVNGLPVVLNAGWNPVGFQAQRLTGLAGTGQVAGVASWTSSGYATGNLDLPSLQGRLGYWIFAREATTFTYSGADDGQGAYVDLPLNGYNLVSFCTNLEIPTAALVARRNGEVVPLNTVVLPQFFELQTNNTYATVDVQAGAGTLKPGRPYWIFANAPVRLSWGAEPLPSPSPSATPTASATPFPTVSPSPGTSPTPGASPVATRLQFSSVPAATAGVASNYGVQVVDQFGHPFTGSLSVSLALNTSPPGATLTAAATATSGGLATIPATFTRAGLNYTLRARAPGLPEAISGTFAVSAGPAVSLGFVAQPQGGLVSSFLYPVTVGLFDSQGNPAPNPGGPLTVAVTGSPSVLGVGSLALGPGASSVSFPNLVPASTGSYTLSASASGFPAATSSPFAITADTGLRVLPFNFSGQGVAGQSQPLVVGFFDSSGNPLPNQAGTITVAGLSAPAVGGFATFTLQPTRAGTVTLAIASEGCPTTQQTFQVAPGPVASLVFSTQPTDLDSTAAGTVAVTALDAFGNVKTDSTAPVRLQLGSGQGALFSNSSPVGPGPIFAVLSGGTATASFRLPTAQAGATLLASWLGPEAVPALASAPFAVNRESAPGFFAAPSSVSDASLSGSGRYVTWVSNENGQILVRDRLAGTTTVASLRDGTDGVPAAGNGQLQPQVSDDGNTVVFVSSADNLVPGGSGTQVYLRRLSTRRTILVSRTLAGGGGNGQSLSPRLSADGTRVAFETEATDLMAATAGGRQVVVATVGDSVTSMRLLSANANSPCTLGGMTSDAAGVVFSSGASNLGGPALGPDANARIFRADASGVSFVAQTDASTCALSDAGGVFWGAGVDPLTGVADPAGPGFYGPGGRLLTAQVLGLAVDRTAKRAVFFELGSFTTQVVNLATGAVTGSLPGGDSASGFQPCSVAARGGLAGYFSSGAGFLISPVP